LDSFGNVCVVGSTEYNGGARFDEDYAVIKYDALSGAEKWFAFYNAGSDDYPNDATIDNEGNVYVTGRSIRPSPNFDYATVKFDSAGNEEWVMRYDGGVSGWDEAVSMRVDGNQNVVVTGKSRESPTFGWDWVTIKYVQPSDPIAQPGIFYAGTGQNNATDPGALISIDPATGAGTLIGPTGIMGDNSPSVHALAIKSTGEIYAPSSIPSSDLYTINASTGAATFLSHTGLFYPDAMAFNGSDILHAAARDSNLYIVDEQSGSTTLIGPMGAAIKGIAFDPISGGLFGSSDADGIYRINLNTGEAVLVGLTGLGGTTPDIHFDQDGNLYGTKSGTGSHNLISISKATGAGTIIGSIGFTAVTALSARLTIASAEPVPCEAISFFAAKCNQNGAGQAMVRILNSTEHSGKTMEFLLDDELYPVTLVDNGTHTIGKLQVPGAGFGQHTVTLANPPGCYEPISFNCQVLADSKDAEFDLLWSEFELLEPPGSSSQIPGETILLDNYPNPFNPSTTFRYSLGHPGDVSIRVYDMLGQLVRTVVDATQNEGYHETQWDGRDNTGAIVASGIYVYRMVAGSYVETKRMLMMK
jgi:hypothetical protein